MKSYPGKKNIILLFLLAFTVKFLSAIFIRYLLSCTPVGYHLDELVIRGDDYLSYNGAMENYIQTGHYYFFNGRHNVFAGRLPHYSLLYFIFRQFLNVPLANFGVLVAQIGLECIAILCLAMLATRVTHVRRSFWMTYILYLLSLATSFYNIIVLPDSLSVSLLILFSYFFYEYLKRPSYRRLLLPGVFLGLTVVLKPYFSLIYLVVGFFFLRETNHLFSRKGLMAVAVKTLVVSIPLLLLLLPWVVRNYQLYHRFVPFQESIIAGYNYTQADLACRRYIHTFGHDFLYWDEKSAAYYFKSCQQNCSFKLPDYLFTEKYGRNEIEAVRSKYLQLQANFSDAQDLEVAAAFDALTNDFRQEKPFRFYIISRFQALGNFLMDNGAVNLPISRSSVCFHKFHLLVKYIQVFLYWVSVTLGFIGLYWLAKKDRHTLLFFAIPVYLLLFFPIILLATEGRYFIHSYPFLILGLVYFIQKLNLKVRRRVTARLMASK
jgi:hypothetical protein